MNGATASTNVGVGTSAPQAAIDVRGPSTGPSLTADNEVLRIAGTSGGAVIAMGSHTSSPFGSFIQSKRGTNDGTSWPLALNPLGGNVGIGTLSPAQRLDVAGNINVSVGSGLLLGNVNFLRGSTTSNNVFLGGLSGGATTGASNVFVGSNTGASNTTGGSNVFIGNNAGITNTTGTGNIIIGAGAGLGSPGLTDAIAIGQGATATISNSIVLGTSQLVGIGISSPTKKLHVVKSPIALYDGAIVGSSSATDNSGFFGAMAYDQGATNFGVFAHSDAIANTSPLGVNRAADGALVSFMSAGSVEGQISVSGTTITYGAFTGVHYAQMENEKVERGMLVSLNGKNGNLHNKKTSEQVYGITKTAVPNDSKVMGAYLGLIDPLAPKSADNPVQIMAVGNGDMWVVDNGMNLEVGDYLISSELAGYAMLDKGDFDIAHVIARVGQNVNWNEVNEKVEGRKVMNVSIFFENFEINHKAQKLLAEIELLQAKVSSMKETQDTEIAALKKQMEVVMRIVGAEAKKKN